VGVVDGQTAVFAISEDADLYAFANCSHWLGTRNACSSTEWLQVCTGNRLTAYFTGPMVAAPDLSTGHATAGRDIRAQSVADLPRSTATAAHPVSAGAADRHVGWQDITVGSLFRPGGIGGRADRDVAAGFAVTAAAPTAHVLLLHELLRHAWAPWRSWFRASPWLPRARRRCPAKRTGGALHLLLAWPPGRGGCTPFWPIWSIMFFSMAEVAADREIAGLRPLASDPGSWPPLPAHFAHPPSGRR
jgi:hypothetical protein